MRAGKSGEGQLHAAVERVPAPMQTKDTEADHTPGCDLHSLILRVQVVGIAPV